MIAAWPVCSFAVNPKRAVIPSLAYPVFRSTTGPSPFLYAGDQFNDRRQAQIVWDAYAPALSWRTKPIMASEKTFAFTTS